MMLTNERSPKFEIKNFPEQVFILDISTFAAFIFLSILANLLVPGAAKHPHSMTLPPPCLTISIVLV